jgi:hypothetical protein
MGKDDLGRAPGRCGGALRAALLAALSSAVGLALVPAAASADTLTVTNTNDSGAGSLRQVVDDASAGDLVRVPAGTYGLTSAELSVDTAITIRGAGAGRTIIESRGGFRVIEVGGPGTTTLTALTVAGGELTSGSGDGAGILATESIVLDSVVVRDNFAEPSLHGDGAGLFQDGGSTSATIRNSLFTGNTNYNGAGFTAEGTLTVLNTTVTGNTAGEPTENGWGGGLAAYGDAIAIRNSTIAANRDFGARPVDLEDSAGGLYANAGAVIRNTIIAGNVSFDPDAGPPGTTGNPGVPNNCADTYMVTVAQDHNLESGTDCLFSGGGSLQSADPLLAPLAENGGPTQTMALPKGSPALSRGSRCEATDQRGIPRSLGGACDAGAYERVLCGGVAVNVVGTGGKDKLRGTNKGDGILGLGGADRISGLRGGDGLCGGKGRDVLKGGGGRDKLFGNAGRDRLIGGKGRDRLRGGPGRDVQKN